jgi:hypothetical protein
MTKSNVERMSDAFVAYLVANLPASVTTANAGKTWAASVLKKIEKATRVNLQYVPCAAISLEGVDFEEAGPGSLSATAEIIVVLVSAENDSTKLSTSLERYVDALVDLVGSDSTMGGSAYNIGVKGMEKGIDPDGKRGVASVTCEISGEFAI